MTSHRYFFASIALAITLVAPSSVRAIVSDGSDRVAVPTTSTIAGSGLRGDSNGPANVATFLAPVGVAVGGDGSIYVADAAAQNIRRIRDGKVEAFVGVSEPGTSPEIRVGGYVDGATRVARFNRPTGVAVHGAEVYVADSGNHCIRRIASDGVRTIARNFGDLRGIAVAEDGTIYAADDGSGIRRILRDGIATTLPLPSDHKTVLGVAVRMIGAHEYLAYTDTTHVYIEAIGAAKPQSLSFDDEREPDGAGADVGHAYGIAILNENTVVVTDTTTHAVRLIRFPAPPFVAGRVVRAIAGGLNESGDVTGGFADGPPWRALLDTPTALAIAGDGSIVVADTGNRRIRKISGLDARESVLPDLSNFAIPEHSYHIAIVGNSYAFYNVLWPESIGGRIEAALTRDAEGVDLSQRPSISTFRVDAASDEAVISLIHEYLSDRRTSLVILMLNSYVAMKSDTLDHLRGQLAGVGVKLMVVFTPQGFEVSPRDFWSAKRDGGEADATKLRAEAARGESYYNMTHVRGLYLLDAMEKQSGERNRRPLFYSSEHHLTIYGSEWVGRRVVEELERWKPWKRDAADTQ